MSKFKVGDRVDFLNDVGGGIVKKILDNKLVLVETEDGFEYPVQERELIKSNRYSEDDVMIVAPDNRPKKVEEIFTDDVEVITKDNEEVNIYLAFLKKPKTIEMNLINDSNWYLLYVIQTFDGSRYTSIPGMLQPNYIETIRNFADDELNGIKNFRVQLIFFRKIPYDTKNPVAIDTNFNISRLFDEKNYTKNDFFEKNALLVPIIEENPMAEAIKKLKNQEVEKIVYQKEVKSKKINEPKKFEKKVKQDLIQIDLHINELLDDTTGMSAAEMLEYQMDTFKKELDAAMKDKHINKIVFIHGKGNGTLKNEIRNYLKQNKLKYQDASFQKYGFGATLVFVSKKFY